MSRVQVVKGVSLIVGRVILLRSLVASKNVLGKTRVQGVLVKQMLPIVFVKYLVS